MKLTIHDFGPILKLQSFEYGLFLIASVSPEAHDVVCNIDDIVKGRYADLFSKYWTESHFLLGNCTYVYSEKYLPGEARYQKGLLMKFINNLEYIVGSTLVKEVDKEHFGALLTSNC